MTSDVIFGITEIGVSVQNLREDIPAFLGDKFRKGKLTFQNLLIKECSLRVFEGQIATDHSIEDDATTPHVYFRPMILKALDHLRGGIARGATSCFQSLIFLIDIG